MIFAPEGCGRDCSKVSNRHRTSGASDWAARVLATLSEHVRPGDVVAVCTSELKFPQPRYVLLT